MVAQFRPALGVCEVDGVGWLEQFHEGGKCEGGVARDNKKSRPWTKPKFNRRAATNPFRSVPCGLSLEGQCPW
jgi:hypothetical protein